MRRPNGSGWTPAAGLLAGIGVLLGAIALFDVYEDVFVQRVSVLLPVLENSVPLALSVGIVLAARRLATSDWERDRQRTVLAWTVFGIAVVVATTGWIYYFQVLQGRIKPRIILGHLATMAAAAGVVVGIYGSRHKRRREQLRTEKRRIETLFENSTDCIAEIRFEGDAPAIRDVNPAFERTFGYDAEAVRGRSIDEVIVPADRHEQATDLSDRARAGERYEQQVRRRTADGETRTFRLQAIPLVDDRSRTDGYAVYTDVTEQRRYARRITALHDATRNLMEATDPESVARRSVEAAADVLDLEVTGVHFVTDEGDALETVALSDRAEELFGHVRTLEPGESLAWEAFETGEAMLFDDVRSADGLYNPDTPIRSEMIVPLGEYGVLITGSTDRGAFDDTDLELARILGANIETALTRADRERTLREREHELGKQNERLETFASVVSHDLRNPLGIAQGYVDLARGADDPEEHLDEVEEALDRMESLIEELLTLARHGESIGDRRRVDLQRIADDAWHDLETEDARLHVASTATLEADPVRLRQALENLFRNAVEHGSRSNRSTSGGAGEHADEAVTVWVGTLPDAAGFYVADDGPGIPPDERDQIFEHGYTTSDDGTGFGLAIVAEIVAAHGWAIDVTESRTGGARFEIRTDRTGA